MKRPYITYLVYGIIAIALFGFVFTLLTNPSQIVGTAFTIGISVLVIYTLFRLFSSTGQGNSNYRKAVKQSAKKYKHSQPKTSQVTHKKQAITSKLEPVRKKTKIRSNAKLTVIEGEKGKKKNRASL